MTILPIDHSPGAMSQRARVYVIAGGMRHFLIGLTIVLTPWMYTSAAFIPIFNLVDQQLWGWIMLVVGMVCVVGAITRKPDTARAGMVASAIVTAVLAVGLLLGVINVWIEFGYTVGGDALLDLINDRPRMFPMELALKMVAPPSPFLPLLLLSVTVKDFTMCAQPLRVPLEDSPGYQDAEA